MKDRDFDKMMDAVKELSKHLEPALAKIKKENPKIFEDVQKSFNNGELDIQKKVKEMKFELDSLQDKIKNLNGNTGY